ncbi:hypothetical protein OUZ56_027075 [Daphnia magna]|uniref:GMP synthase n=1 Tax=Daphnia magna TaxID=35525 RepID=A0ABQ9ZNQ9_9CRUS|nr:hypothetical protein OUZ56_027075 [Daphnia magna]
MPDLIESASYMASSLSDAIKTHHNDSEMVRQLRLHGRVVEPIKGTCLALKLRGRQKSVFFWKNCPVTTSMLPRYCPVALSSLQGFCRTYSYCVALSSDRFGLLEASPNADHLDPSHFNRDSSQRIPSCQRSVVFRPFFFTGFYDFLQFLKSGTFLKLILL